jgi:hypothetical protein
MNYLQCRNTTEFELFGSSAEDRVQDVSVEILMTIIGFGQVKAEKSLP